MVFKKNNPGCHAAGGCACEADCPIAGNWAIAETAWTLLDGGQPGGAVETDATGAVLLQTPTNPTGTAICHLSVALGIEDVGDSIGVLLAYTDEDNYVLVEVTLAAAIDNGFRRGCWRIDAWERIGGVTAAVGHAMRLVTNGTPGPPETIEICYEPGAEEGQRVLFVRWHVLDEGTFAHEIVLDESGLTADGVSAGLRSGGSNTGTVRCLDFAWSLHQSDNPSCPRCVLQECTSRIEYFAVDGFGDAVTLGSCQWEIISGSWEMVSSPERLSPGSSGALALARNRRPWDHKVRISAGLVMDYNQEMMLVADYDEAGNYHWCSLLRETTYSDDDLWTARAGVNDSVLHEATALIEQPTFNAARSATAILCIDANSLVYSFGVDASTSNVAGPTRVPILPNGGRRYGIGSRSWSSGSFDGSQWGNNSTPRFGVGHVPPEDRLEEAELECDPCEGELAECTRCWDDEDPDLQVCQQPDCMPFDIDLTIVGLDDGSPCIHCDRHGGTIRLTFEINFLTGCRWKGSRSSDTPSDDMPQINVDSGVPEACNYPGVLNYQFQIEKDVPSDKYIITVSVADPSLFEVHTFQRIILFSDEAHVDQETDLLLCETLFSENSSDPEFPIPWLSGGPGTGCTTDAESNNFAFIRKAVT